MMRVTAELARVKAEAFLDEMVLPGVAMDVLVDPGATVETDHCWVFFCNTREFIETRSAIFALAGNAPIFVAKDDPGVYESVVGVPGDSIDWCCTSRGNAAAAGLIPGVPIGPTPVWVVHQPWPLSGPG